MKTIILCGGKGTRLREETEYRPKPMVPIGDKPIIWHIMKTYAAYGHNDFIVFLEQKRDVIKNFFRNYRWSTSDVTLDLHNICRVVISQGVNQNIVLMKVPHIFLTTCLLEFIVVSNYLTRKVQGFCYGVKNFWQPWLDEMKTLFYIKNERFA